MNLRIFVLHYANDELTNECLRALVGDAEAVNYGRVTVIDNGSPVPFAGIWDDVIRFDENLHLIEAFNRAMQQNPADAYICMANDTKPAPGMVGKLLAALDDPSVGIVAPGTNDIGAGMLWVPYPSDWAPMDTSNVDNTCWSFRQDLVDKIGWPDCEGHSHRANWAANQDFCFRARMEGYRVVGVRGAYIEHAHNGGSDIDAWKAGRDWLVMKWGEKAQEVWA